MPLVSVVMTVRNGERFLEEAVTSVLAQEGAPLELLVVDDASTDGTAALLASILDERLKVIRLAHQVGPFAAANVGLECARGDFIARLDADDVALPGRLERQVEAFEHSPDVGLVGGACERIDVTGASLGPHDVPRSDLAIRLRALLAPPFVHSTVMWRASLGLRYEPALRVAGDYELWCRALEKTRALNLGEPLVRYRVWAGGITGTQGALQQATQDEISFRALRRHLPDLDVDREAVTVLRRWSLEGQVAPMPEPARRLIAQLEAAFFGVAPELARAVHAPLGSWGQPLAHATA
ncbi:MAG: glycosyltransferase [Myxococcota bacterium]